MTIPFANIPFLNKKIKFPVTPHIPGGLTTSAQLRQIAEIADKYEGSLKIVGNTITIIGLNLSDGEKALAELNCQGESFIAKAVRSVAFCPGKPDCPRALQDSSSLGLALDKEFFGQELPGKLRIGVSGCPNCCIEPLVKDIGMYGTAKGYTLAVGGNSGFSAQIATVVAEKVPAEEISSIIQSILTFYRQHGKTKERLGQLITRIGWEQFINETIPSQYKKRLDL
ncbi:nitrite reductase [Pelosinus sp. UFO1]|uniref:nitrite reductase n=1 Tax=Pelosinus sp. UFO1 TaxID=484770 RepID=UPI0004D1808B|nr:nitrite reductase [Pelosinus sp. UFO1]AIF54213.1 nitrite and sulfite reductase 4Fe-4S region [Pelosinus sp. UFO1]